MKKFLCIAVLIGFVAIPAFIAPTPVQAFTHDQDPTPLAYDTGSVAQWGTNALTQAWGTTYDVLLGGMFYRGIQVAQSKEENSFWQLESGLRYLVTQEHLFDRASTLASVQKIPAYYDENGQLVTGKLANYLANNRLYTYGKIGAATGGLLAAAYGPFAGTTMIQTYAASTAAGAIGGAGVGFGIDYIAPK